MRAQTLVQIFAKNIIVRKIAHYFDPSKIALQPDYQKRAYIMGGVCAALIVFILLRYACISFIPTKLREQLVNAGSKQSESSVTLTQPRAIITDRNGHPLALSVPSTSIFLLTRKMPKDLKTLQAVSQKLSIPLDQLIKYSKQKKKFVWLKRHLNHAEMEKIGSLKPWIDFIGTADEPKRIYPEKDLAAQLIGFVGSDGNGLEGIERIYNNQLKAKPTKAEVSRDARGHYVIATPSLASKPDQLADNFELSIDMTIQTIAQTALRNSVYKTNAIGGSAVVMDIQTGEILALASYPVYDLNEPSDSIPEARRFKPVMDAIELGSVVKPIFIAKALDLKVISTSTKIFAENGQMAVPGGFIHDTHQSDWLTPEEIIKISSNIGTYKIVQKIGRKAFYQTLMDIGFGRAPGTGLPGEWSGRIHPPEKWSEMRFANMAFGQGFAISPLQLAHAYCIIAGGGLDRGVSLLKLNSGTNFSDQNQKSFDKNQKQFISPDVSQQILKMLKTVTEDVEGTGSAARIAGVLVAGKTGTAQIWSEKTKSYSERTPVFAGVIPAQNPKIAIVVVLDQVKVRPAFGGPLAGPVFAEIGKNTLNYLNSRGLFTYDPYENAYLKKVKNDHQNSTR